MILRFSALLSIALGLVFLGISLIGNVFPPTFSVRPQAEEMYDPNLRSHSFRELIGFAKSLTNQEFDNLSPERKVRLFYHAVAMRFAWSPDRAPRHVLLSNWIMWAAGMFDANASIIRDPRTLLRHARYAWCSEQSYMLVLLAERAGIPARHVGLGTHAVMEARYDGEWHMFDPTLEVIPVIGGKILSVEEMADSPEALSRYARYPDILQAFLDDTQRNYISYPADAQFVWKAQVLLLVERLSEWLKFMAPGVLLLGGLLVLRRENGRQPRRFAAVAAG